jgi:phasin
MSSAPFQIPKEISIDEARKTTEKGLAQSRAAFEKFNAAAKETYASIDSGASIAAKGLSEFNAKAFEAFQANTAMTFDFFSALTGSKSVSDIIALAPAHASKQFQALKDQTKDLSSLAQKIVKESAEPLKSAIGKSFPPQA